MANERRRHSRLTVRAKEVDGFFRIHLNDEWHPLTEVHDVSISGMGLRFTSPIDPGTTLKIAYMSRDMEITLPATVRWCRDGIEHDNPGAESPGCLLGIEFDSNNVNDNMLMFMAIRKYLDAFT